MSKKFPSEEDILCFVKDSKKPVTKRDIAKFFSIKGNKRITLKKMLKQMTTEEIIHKPPNEGYSITKDKKISHDTTNNNGLIGSITILSDKSGVFIPAERGRNNSVQIPKESLKNIKNNDLVIINFSPRQKVINIKVLGHKDDPNLLSLISIYQNKLPHIFPENVLKETETMTVPTALENREDLQNTPLITIDGADAKDFDDAVFAEPDDSPKNKNGWHIIVAIADVSYYVRAGTALNEHAYERGNSTYFPDRVVPMLPEKLSNDLCSLRPDEPRACLVAHLWINSSGKLINYKFTRGLMKSHARLTYEQVEEAYNGSPDKQTSKIFTPVIKPLYDAYSILKKARQLRGALDIDLPEYQVNINKVGGIEGISKRVRLNSHQLIEEFMVLANVAAAKALEKNKTTTVYRIHPKPDSLKLASAHNFFKSLGHNFEQKVNPKPKDINAILNKVKSLDIAHLANMVILRSQNRAVYHTENQGHFGLSLSHYTHFTSPIRRYSDLLVHRALVKTFDLGVGGQTESEAIKMPEMAEHISDTERRSITAERSAMDRYTALYLVDRVEAEFEATINGINKAGLFITLKDSGSDGFIPARTLPQDFYTHDEAKHALIGKRTRLKFQICEHIMVKLIEVEPLAGSAIFVLTEHNGKPISTKKENSNKKHSFKKKYSKRKKRN